MTCAHARRNNSFFLSIFVNIIDTTFWVRRCACACRGGLSLSLNAYFNMMTQHDDSSYIQWIIKLNKYNMNDEILLFTRLLLLQYWLQNHFFLFFFVFVGSEMCIRNRQYWLQVVPQNIYRYEYRIRLDMKKKIILII